MKKQDQIVQLCRLLRINERQLHNLIKMGLWLYDNRVALKRNFNIRQYAHHEATGTRPPPLQMLTSDLKKLKAVHECGTSCCIIGHSVRPEIGLRFPDSNEMGIGYGSKKEILEYTTWPNLGFIMFGATWEAMNTVPESWPSFLFSGSQANCSMAAVKRIFYLLSAPRAVITKIARIHADPAFGEPFVVEVHASATTPKWFTIELDPRKKWKFKAAPWRSLLRFMDAEHADKTAANNK